MKKPKKHRAQQVLLLSVKAKRDLFWWPLPYDKKNRFIPSSVDCLFNTDYFSDQEAINMLLAL